MSSAPTPAVSNQQIIIQRRDPRKFLQYFAVIIAVLRKMVIMFAISERNREDDDQFCQNLGYQNFKKNMFCVLTV